MNIVRKYSSPYMARDYFSKDILPRTLYAGRKTIRQNIPYRQHEETAFMLVRKGTATITINAHSYRVSPGSLLCLSPAHFYKVELDKGEPLEISECHVNAGVYFYITACPYYNEAPSRLPCPPVCAILDDAGTDHVTALIDRLRDVSHQTDIPDNQTAFFLLMKLFGILEHFQVTDNKGNP